MPSESTFARSLRFQLANNEPRRNWVDREVARYRKFKPLRWCAAWLCLMTAGAYGLAVIWAYAS